MLNQIHASLATQQYLSKCHDHLQQNLANNESELKCVFFFFFFFFFFSFLRVSKTGYTITKTRLYKYIVNFTAENTKIFRWKIVIFFLFLLKI